ncbi:MAG: hypothetical protein EOO29_04430 [Comamonadaceae bacterium]|nr:MAG: hypothetical protein EOO29_04430 [Comamonadaceae bacterium]
MKTLAVFLAVASCVNALTWRKGVLRALLLFGFGALGVPMALLGGFAYWWDSSMQPSQKSATLMVCGIVMVLMNVVGALRSVRDDPWD